MAGGPLPGAPLAAPLVRGGKIACQGVNYASHATSVGPAATPFFFWKPASAVVPPGGAIQYDERDDQLDFEIELAAVIGMRSRDLTVENALDHVAGYTIVNDGCRASGFNSATPDLRARYGMNWVHGKGVTEVVRWARGSHFARSSPIHAT